jgi:hypothetical protein
VLDVQEQGPYRLSDATIFLFGFVCNNLSQIECFQLRTFNDMHTGLEQAIWAIEDVKTELNMLYEYVNP